MTKSNVRAYVSANIFSFVQAEAFFSHCEKSRVMQKGKIKWQHRRWLMLTELGSCGFSLSYDITLPTFMKALLSRLNHICADYCAALGLSGAFVTCGRRFNICFILTARVLHCYQKKELFLAISDYFILYFSCINKFHTRSPCIESAWV